MVLPNIVRLKFFGVLNDKYLCIENFNETKCHSELSEESQSPAKV